MMFIDPPPFAAWRHVDARDGFEVVFIERTGDGWPSRGTRRPSRRASRRRSTT